MASFKRWDDGSRGDDAARPDASARRSDGVLSADAVARLRELGVALAYDPVQIGWVMLDCLDDFDEVELPLSWHMSGDRPVGYLFRNWRERDAPAMARILSSPRLWQYLPEEFGGPMEPNTAIALIALSNEAEHHLVRAVEFDGRVIGQVRLEYHDGDRDAAEISYWLDEDYWGKGHAGAFVSRFADDALSDRNELGDLTRLFARVHRDNPASARLLLRAGFHLNEDATKEPWRTYERHRDGSESGSDKSMKRKGASSCRAGRRSQREAARGSRAV